MKGYDFLFWGYSVVWIAIVAYLAYLAVRLKRVRERLDRVERRLPADGPGTGAQKSSGS